MHKTQFPNPLAGRTLPRWYDDAKFGIFVHWGVHSVPGWASLEPYAEANFSEHYQNAMLTPNTVIARYHAERYGDLPYDAFAEQFREHVKHWDPEPWADLFERAGARYVVLTSKFEDSFMNWPSALPHPVKENWQLERDVVGELAAAVRARGMRFGIYYCGLDYTFSHLQLPVANHLEAIPQSEEWAAYAEAHWHELIERYKPDVMWPDYSLPTHGNWNELARWYVEQVPEGVVNDRLVPWAWRPQLREGDGESTGIHHDFRTWESVVTRGKTYDLAPATKKWESCRSVGLAWGYNRAETDASYDPAGDLIRELVEVTARGGNLLLNVGPTSTGEIPFLQAQRFADIGWWLRRYGEAIYGTRRWVRPTGTCADGLGVCYTAADDAVHAIVMGAPKQAEIELDVGLERGAEAFVVGSRIPLTWEATDHGTRIALPDVPDAGEPAIALRLSPPRAVRG